MSNVIFPDKPVKEETAAEYAERMQLETAGETKREYRHLEGRSHAERDMVLQRDFGLIEGPDGTMLDSETGDPMSEPGEIYAK